jgi:hypothetical protein
MTSENSNDLLYHYTSEAGLWGIVQSDCIWATHVRFLNDWTEFQEAFAVDYVRTLAESFLSGPPPEGVTEEDRRVAEEVFSQHERILEVLNALSDRYDTFVCAFSADGGDRLSQWRGYSNSVQGFSIGFDHGLLAQPVKNYAPRDAEIRRCIYDEEGKRSWARSLGARASEQFAVLMKKTEPASRPLTSVGIRATALLALARASAEFSMDAATFKHPGFREEFEHRAIVRVPMGDVAPDTLKFRDGRFGKTPYLEIPLGLENVGTSPLKRIVIGPGANREDVARAVRLFLIKHRIPVQAAFGSEGVEIAVSVIPYRQR